MSLQYFEHAMTVESFLAKSPITLLGRACIAGVREMGKFAIFFLSSFFKMFVPPVNTARIIQQIHFIGMKSLFVVGLTGLFTGMVLGLQGYYTLVRYGSETALGTAVALSLIRELGPVLTALMVTGRAGSSMAAEIGIMRISEQIDALDTMDIDPLKFLVSPRLAASIVSLPLLTAVFDVIGIIGGYVTGVMLLGVNSGTFLSRMEMGVLMKDVSSGFTKSFVFALIIAAICCYMGFTTHERREGFGARGVSLATTAAVVTSSVLILIVDYILTSFML
jgi:phospholipid/cholesterol/gamma-HCH transport system permease protein